ncbi:MAG: protein kinase family protein [Bacilli bacterium]
MSNKFDIWLKNTINTYSSGTEDEYIEFYSDEHELLLSGMLAIFHKQLNYLFGYMNSRLGNGHYTAHESRELIGLIEDIEKFKGVAKKFNLEVELEENYQYTIDKCNEFLSPSGGSHIPEDFKRINIIDYDSIFKVKTDEYIEIKDKTQKYEIKHIGEGSYAKVFKYKDKEYNKTFVIKRANKDLRDDEFKRFELEFKTMDSLSSPYIVEVYRFDEENMEYVMEHMDETLEKYIHKNNTKLTINDRVMLVRQILRAFKYIHSKGVLHRDISTKNILVKKYDDIVVLKISDFGLVKIPNSDLTRKGTEIKGSLNDHKSLEIVGFDNFKIEHETYAITKLIYFIMRGKETLAKYNTTEYNDFVSKGISDNLNYRYKDIEELESAFNRLIKILK